MDWMAQGADILKLSGDVARHVYVQWPVVLILFEIDTTVQLTFPDLLHIVGLGEHLAKVFVMLMPDIFHAKIIDHKHEFDGMADMPP